MSLECGGSSFKLQQGGSKERSPNPAVIEWIRLRTNLDISITPGPGFISQLQRRGIPLTHLVVLTDSLAELDRQLSIAGTQADALQRTPMARSEVERFETELRRTIERVAAAVHEWATGVYVAHRFRHLTGRIFDRLKTSADAALAKLCKGAIEKLNHAIERAGTDNPEAWSAAAMSCRRALKDFADVVYPPRAELVDGRKVGPEEYKNRLWAFAREKGSAAMESEALSSEEMDGLWKSLDRIYELDSKGVHDKVSKQEADLLVIRTYVLLAQLAALHAA